MEDLHCQSQEKKYDEYVFLADAKKIFPSLVLTPLKSQEGRNASNEILLEAEVRRIDLFNGEIRLEWSLTDLFPGLMAASVCTPPPIVTPV